MISENLHWEGGAMEIVLPRFRGMDDSQKFLVIDIIVLFCRGEQLGKICKSMDAICHWSQSEGGWHQMHILKCQ